MPDGDLDACFSVIDAHLTLRTPEQASSVCDVLVRGAVSTSNDPFTQVIDARDRQTGAMIAVISTILTLSAAAIAIGVVYNNFDPQAPGGYSSHDYYHQYYGQPDTAASRSVKTRRFGIRIRTRAQGNGFDVAAAPRSAGAGRSKGSEG